MHMERHKYNAAQLLPGWQFIYELNVYFNLRLI